MTTMAVLSRVLRMFTILAVAAAFATIAPVAAQSDLDALMERVLARRDDNWKKLQQYILEEGETLAVTGPDGRRLYGTERTYLWYPWGPGFLKSPLTADGVTIGETERRRYERAWLLREDARAKRRAGLADEGDKERFEVSVGPAGVVVRRNSPASQGGATIDTVVRDALEPGFVSSAYFLNFKFESGHYALVGRETFAGRDVLRIEYYPTMMFKEGRTRPNRELRKRDVEIEAKMNKASVVTLWVEPAIHQIVRYEFRNIDADFLPAGWLVHLDGLTAAMEMGQPFPEVWLPRSLSIGFAATLAIGPVSARYSAEYRDYRVATVDADFRVR